MRKILSLIMSLLMLFTTFMVGEKVFAISHEDDLQGFIDETKELLTFEPEQLIETNSANDDENKDNKDFSTCRLIVKSDKKPKKLNSIGMASGFKDYYIIQFKNEIDAKNAFKYYSECKEITAISVDEEIEGITENSQKDDIEQPTETLKRTECWGAESIGLYALKDYVINNNISLPRVTVGVVGTGVDLEQEFFKGRLEKTGFDSSEDNSGSEQAYNDDHETYVTSVIVDSTTDNVVIRNYKCSSDGQYVFSALFSGFLQAITDNVDIVNCSWTTMLGYGWKKESTYYMFEDAIKVAREKDILIVSSAGNYVFSCLEPKKSMPASSDYTLTVSACDETLYPCNWTAISKYVDVVAPGENIRVIGLNSKHVLSDGTSFSAPYVVSICAMTLSFHPEYSVDDLKDAVKETATPYDDFNGDISKIYGTGVADAIGAVGLPRPSLFANLKPGKYTEKISVDFSSNYDIYYTMDGTYPTEETGIHFSEPIEIYGNMELIKAVAYDDNNIPSVPLSGVYRSSALANESDFEIDSTGAIKAYNGELKDMTIPSSINGIAVTGIKGRAFSNVEIYGITLPETMTQIGRTGPTGIVVSNAFRENKTIMYIEGKNIEAIGTEAFYSCENLRKVDFPKTKEIYRKAFYGCTHLVKNMTFPSVEKIEFEAFYGSNVISLNLPNLETCGGKSFAGMDIYQLNCPKLRYIDKGYPSREGNIDLFRRTSYYSNLDLPEITDFNGEKIFSLETSPLETYCISRLEFSKLKSINDFPDVYSTMVFPSTVESLPDDLSEYSVSTYTIYGSSGTHVEKYAKEKGFDFIEVTPETAVITDLLEYYKPYMGELEADVVGFNRQYQWYANDVNSNEGGTPIEGATGKTFNPADYYAPYYYCVVTSKDGDFDPITIKTSACENRTQTADYTALDKVLNEFDSSKSELYTAESWSDYSTAVAVGASIDRGLVKSKQNIIDAAVKEIINARNNLVRKNAVSARVIGTPTLGANAVVEITVNGSPEAIRFIDGEKNAVTFDRSSALTVKDGDNEIWRIKLAVTSEKAAYSIFVKYNEDYIDSGVTLIVTASSGPDLGIHSVSIPDMYPSGTYTDGRIYAGVHDVIIRTSKDVLKIQFIDSDGNTRTFSKYSTPPTEDGDELVWTIPLKFNLGKMNLGIRTRAVHTTFALTGEYVTGRVLF